MRLLRGAEIGMIFQEPMMSLNPLLTIGEQVGEGLRRHAGIGRQEAATRAVALLARVGIAAPASSRPRLPAPPLRRHAAAAAMIAIALACSPSLLIARRAHHRAGRHHPGSGPALIRDLQAELGMGVLFVTHDLGVVAEIADRVAAMYAGRIVESGPVRALFARPRHPYTRALLASLPRIEPSDTTSAELQPIPGHVPSPLDLPPGCAFAARCPLACADCEAGLPPFTPSEEGGLVACIRAHETA